MSDTVTNQRLLRLATYASFSVALILVAAKAFAWWQSGSLALLSSLLDSGLDALASLLNLLAVRTALTPADHEHRFGHGKAEALAGLGQAALIGGSALFLVGEAVQKLRAPEPPEHSGIGIAVMVFSILLTAALVLFQRHVVRRTGSLAVTADRLHYVSDLLTNLTVIAALVLASRPGFDWVDPAGALLVAMVIFKSAADIVRQALDQLMDRELTDAERDSIRATVLKHPEAQAMHDLRTRNSGQHVFIQFHLELDPDLTLRAAHRISEEIITELHQLFPGAEVILRQDPAGVIEERPPFAAS